MSLVMLDLDNTLVDRDAAFRSAVADLLAAHRLPADDLAWVMSVDASGYAPRDTVATALTDRYGAHLEPAVRALLDTGGADRVTLTPADRAALHRLRAAGRRTVIVTNGRTAQQESKIRTAGLDRLVDAWVVSAAVGHRKPDPEIFHLAAARVGLPLAGAWMIGDSPRADVAGAAALGLHTVWITRRPTWPPEVRRPTHTAPDLATAIDLLLAP
jgi:putative hydrolase of the HAD superfamily